jgi:hypothetical protein
MRLLPGFGSAPAPVVPAAPPPPPTREDPAITEAKTKLRASEVQRKGRGAAILTSPEGQLGDPTVDRPQARSGSQLLGQTGG